MLAGSQGLADGLLHRPGNTTVQRTAFHIQAQEARLAQQGAALRADLLLVPHHGSKTSSSELLLEAVQPSLAVVQVGYRNRFGHPAAPVLERYRVRAIPVIDSPRCGAAGWHSAQPAKVTCQRELAPRYWHHRLP